MQLAWQHSLRDGRFVCRVCFSVFFVWLPSSDEQVRTQSQHSNWLSGLCWGSLLPGPLAPDDRGGTEFFPRASPRRGAGQKPHSRATQPGLPAESLELLKIQLLGPQPRWACCLGAGPVHSPRWFSCTSPGRGGGTAGGLRALPLLSALMPSLHGPQRSQARTRSHPVPYSMFVASSETKISPKM